MTQLEIGKLGKKPAKDLQSNKAVHKLITKLTTPEEYPKMAQRRHHIHFQLRKRGIVIDPEKKTVSLSYEMQAKLSKNEQSWISELKNKFKYEIQSAIHIQPQLKQKPMEQNQTNFFTAILPYLEHAGMRIVIDNEEGQLSVSILPQTKKGNAPFRITPFNAQGTAAEMDEGLLAQLAIAYEKLEAAGLKTNAEDFAEGIEVREKSKKAPSAKSKTPSAKKQPAAPKVKAAPKKPVPPPYYNEDEQKQIKTRLDSMRTESENEEKTFRQLKEASTDAAKQKQYDGMMKAPIAQLKKINDAFKQFDAKKLGFKGKKLVPIAQLVKNPIA